MRCVVSVLEFEFVIKLLKLSHPQIRLQIFIEEK